MWVGVRRFGVLPAGFLFAARWAGTTGFGPELRLSPGETLARGPVRNRRDDVPAPGSVGPVVEGATDRDLVPRRPGFQIRYEFGDGIGRGQHLGRNARIEGWNEVLVDPVGNPVNRERANRPDDVVDPVHRISVGGDDEIL